MTRYELIQAFHKLARILFTDHGRSDLEIMNNVKLLVIDVLTENVTTSPIKFGNGEDDKTGGI